MRHGLYPTLDGRLVVAKEHPRINFPRPISYTELSDMAEYVSKSESLRISLSADRFIDTSDYRVDSGNERGRKRRTERITGTAEKHKSDEIIIDVPEENNDQSVRFLAFGFRPILNEMPFVSQHYDLIGSITRGVKSYFLTHPYRVNSAAQR